jgi:hypothetical protein
MASLFAKNGLCLTLAVWLPQTLRSAATEVLLGQFVRRGLLKFIILLSRVEFFLVGKLIFNILKCP